MFLTATPQGYRRKIGPRSRYGTTPDEPAYERTPQRVGMSPQRVGSKTAGSGIDEHFGSMAGRVQQEKNERETADRFLADKETRRSNQARKAEQAAKAQTQTSDMTNAGNAASKAVAGGSNAFNKVTGGVSAFLDSMRNAPKQRNDEREATAAANRAKGRAKADAEAGRTPTVASTASPSTPKDGFKSAIDSEDQAWAKKRMAAKRLNREIGENQGKQAVKKYLAANPAPKEAPTSRNPLQSDEEWKTAQAERKTAQVPTASHASPTKPASSPAPSSSRFGMARSKPVAKPASQSAAPTPKQAPSQPKTQAQRNPQGLSAKLGDKPRGLDDDMLVGGLVRGTKSVARSVTGSITSQAKRNPHGLAGKVSRFFGS